MIGIVAPGKWEVPALQFEFRSYCRVFKQPLQTHHGTWSQREGIILRLADEWGRVGWGEVAPVPWFGSETMAAATEFCRHLSITLGTATTVTIPDPLPACQFGLESALEMLAPIAPPPAKIGDRFAHSALLPAGAKALTVVPSCIEQGYTTFKWKIGIHDLSTELEQLLPQLIAILPPTSRLRLDANGGLTVEQAICWLDQCDLINQRASQYQCCCIEFLEQPLPPDRVTDMLPLADRYTTLIALDESVATIAQLRNWYMQGWRDVFVVKPAIAGSPRRLRQFCQETGIDVVVSSVFETTIGQQAICTLATAIMTSDRALGMGLDHWFADDDPLRCQEGEALWNLL